MKKLILTFISIISAVSLYAQKPAENVYGAIYGGAAFSRTFKGNPLAGVEIGVYVVPSAGISVEAFELFNGRNNLRDNMLLNGKINFSNLFSGKNSGPKVLDVVGFAGAGFGRDHDKIMFSRNYIALVSRTCFIYTTGFELGLNLGKRKEWQITLKPSIMWDNYITADQRKWTSNAVPVIKAGVSYRMFFGRNGGKGKKCVSHPICISPKDTVRIEERIVRDTVKIVNVETRAVAIVYFEKGKSKITEKQMAPIDFFVNNLGNTREKILITGSADTSTWNDADNMKLAQKRADAVKAVLVEKYGIREDDIDTEAVLDVFEDPVSSRSAILE